MELSRLQAVVESFATQRPASLDACEAWAARAASAVEAVRAAVLAHPASSKEQPLGLKSLALLTTTLDLLTGVILLPFIPVKPLLPMQPGSSAAAPGAAAAAFAARNSVLAPKSVTAPTAADIVRAVQDACRDRTEEAAASTSPLAAPRCFRGEGAAARALALCELLVPLLVSPHIDRRMKDRYCPDLTIVCLHIASNGHAEGEALSPAAASFSSRARSVLATLADGLGPRVQGCQLLQLMWGQWLRGAIVAPFYPASPDAPVSVPTPGAETVSIPERLRILVSGELSSMVAAPGTHRADGIGIGVEGLVDAVLDAVDTDNPAAVDRALALCSTVVSRPPSAASATAYWGIITPQLMHLLALRGDRAEVIRRFAAVTVGVILSEGAGAKGSDSGAFATLLGALAGPLLAVTRSALPSSSSFAVLADWPALCRAVELCHAVFVAEGQPLPPVPALAVLSQLCTPLIALLLALRGGSSNTEAAAAGDALATAATETLSRLVSLCPPAAAAHVLLCAAGMTATANRCFPLPPPAIAIIAAASGNAPGATSDAPLVPAGPAPGVAFEASPRALVQEEGEAAGSALSRFRLVCRPPRDENEVDGGSDGLPSLQLPRRGGAAAPSLSSPSLRAADLFSIGSRSALGASNDAVAASGSRSGAVGGLDSMPLDADPRAAAAAARSAALANLLGDVLAPTVTAKMRAPVSQSSDKAGANAGASSSAPREPVAGLLFAALLGQYARARVAALLTGDAFDEHDEGSAGEGVGLTAVATTRKGEAAPIPEPAPSSAPAACLPPAAFDGEGVARTQTLIVLSERLGPALLRTSQAVLRTVRAVLHVCVAAAGLPVPDPAAVGLGGAADAAAITLHASFSALGASRGRVTDVSPSASAVPTRLLTPEEKAHVSELVSLCLSLLTCMVVMGEAALAATAQGSGDDDALEGLAALLLGAVPDAAGGLREAPVEPPPAPALEPTLYAAVRSFLPLLAALAAAGPDVLELQLAEMAGSLQGLVLTLPQPVLVGERRTLSDAAQPTDGVAAARQALLGTLRSRTVETLLRDGMRLALDLAPAVQGHALKLLTRAVRMGLPREEEADGGSSGDSGHAAPLPPIVTSLVDIFTKQLQNADAFLHLAAVDGLRALARSLPWGAQLLPAFSAWYGEGRLLPLERVLGVAGDTAPAPSAGHYNSQLLGSGSAGEAATAAAAKEAAAPLLAPSVRVRLGEALALAVSEAARAGVLPAYLPALLPVLLKLGPGGWRAQEAALLRLHAAQASRSSATPKLGKGASSTRNRLLSLLEEGDDSGGGDGTSEAGAAPKDPEHPYNLGLVLADAAELRASALGLLGVAAAHAGVALAPWAADVLSGLGGVLRFERDALKALQPSQQVGGAPVRAAAIDDETAVVAGALAARVRRAAAVALVKLVEDPSDPDPRSPKAKSKGAGGTRLDAAPLLVLALRTPDAGLCLRAALDIAREAAGTDPDATVRAHATDACALIEDALTKAAQKLAAAPGTSSGSSSSRAPPPADVGPLAAGLLSLGARGTVRRVLGDARPVQPRSQETVSGLDDRDDDVPASGALSAASSLQAPPRAAPSVSSQSSAQRRGGLIQEVEAAINDRGEVVYRETGRVEPSPG